MSQFFGIKQSIAGNLDHRYIPWLVSVMNKREFPRNIKILSWNYDSQIQIAASKLGYIEASPNPVESYLTCFPTINSDYDRNKVSLIHLNGRAGLTETESVFQKHHERSKSDCLTFLCNQEIESGMHFAWEDSDYHNGLMGDVSLLLQDVTQLVVIGYSFPFFNREVDKLVFQGLLSNSRFKKIYFQDPKLNGSQLRSQFNISDKIDIIHVDRIDNFHIPFDY